jgi:hypothetical protein
MGHAAVLLIILAGYRVLYAVASITLVTTVLRGTGLGRRGNPIIEAVYAEAQRAQVTRPGLLEHRV